MLVAEFKIPDDAVIVVVTELSMKRLLKVAVPFESVSCAVVPFNMPFDEASEIDIPDV